MEDIKRTFARNLNQAMEAKGMSQSDLARLVYPQSGGPGAVGRGNIGAYLTMNSLPSPSNLRKISNALRVPAEELMPAEGRQAFEQPDVRLEFIGASRARLKVSAVVSTKIALKVAELIETDRGTE